VDDLDRRPQVAQRLHRLAMLARQIELGVGAVGDRLDLGQQRRPAGRIERPAVARPAECQGDQELAQPPGEREGRVRGDHEAVVHPADPPGEGLEGDGRAVGADRQTAHQRLDPSPVGLRIDLAQIGPQPLGARNESVERQPAQQPVERGVVEPAVDQPFGEPAGEALDRVGERVPLGRRPHLAERVGERAERRIGRLRCGGLRPLRRRTVA